MNWYVVTTHSGYENKAKLALEDAITRAGIEHKFGEVLVPTEQVVEVRDGKKKTTTRKSYPGYMFVQMDMDNESFHVVRTTPKVKGFIGGSRNPPPMPEDEVGRVSKSRKRRRPQWWSPISSVAKKFASSMVHSFMNGKVEEVNATARSCASCCLRSPHVCRVGFHPG